MKYLNLLRGLFLIIYISFFSDIYSNVASIPHTQHNCIDVYPTLELNAKKPCSKFSFDVPVSGQYYIGFLTNISGGTETSYDVIVNNVYQGKLLSTTSGWEVLSLSTNAKIALNEGENSILVMSNNKEYPNISNMRCSISESDISDLLISDISDPQRAVVIVPPGDNPVKTGVPIKYSYNTTMELSAGDYIYIYLYGDNDFIVDLTYIGSYGAVSQCSSRSRRSLFDINNLSQDSSSPYAAHLISEISLSGKYIISLRSGKSGVGGNISGAIFTYNWVVAEHHNWELISSTEITSQPFYSKSFPITIPSDGKNHWVYAKGANMASDNVMMFVESGSSSPGRIVAYNDNCPATIYQNFNGTRNDAYINQTFYLPASAIHVFNKVNRNSSATIYSDVLSAISAQTIDERDCPKIINSDFTVSSSIKFDSNIKEISSHTLDGAYISQHILSDTTNEVSLNTLGIAKTGNYIIRYSSDGINYNSQIIQIK